MKSTSSYTGEIKGNSPKIKGLIARFAIYSSFVANNFLLWKKDKTVYDLKPPTSYLYLVGRVFNGSGALCGAAPI